jgi:hypothetical protein
MKNKYILTEQDTVEYTIICSVQVTSESSTNHSQGKCICNNSLFFSSHIAYINVPMSQIYQNVF